MNPVRVLKNAFINLSNSAQLLAEIREGIANMTDVIARQGGAAAAGARRPETAETAPARQIAAAEATRDAVRVMAMAPPPPGNRREPAAAGASQRISAPPGQLRFDINAVEKYAKVFEGIAPYSGTPPKGFYADWIGALTDAKFRAYLGVNPDEVGGSPVSTRLPVIEDGEGWFEAVNQVLAARDARGQFVMITLGACYGAQAVGSFLTLQKLNPMPCKLVAVEPEPTNLAWVARHFSDNGINPDDHWLVGSAISDTNSPVFFPVGAPGTGAQNSFSTNETGAREFYVRSLIDSGRAEEALRNLLLRNTTGLKKDLLPGGDFEAEITVMSAVTLKDILSPYDCVDYLEVDIQQSEIIVFPPFMDLVKRKVRRVHLGTHGGEVHAALAKAFRDGGWEIVFDFAPNGEFTTPLGKFTTNDGVLSIRNPDL